MALAVAKSERLYGIIKFMTASSQLRDDFDLQAELFGNYLLKGQAMTPQVRDLFAKTMRNTPVRLSTADQKLLDYALSNPRLLGLLDAGAALVMPDAEVRRRLYIMFAILEANTEYWDFFLPKQRNRWYLFVVAGAGIRGALKGIFGIILVKKVVAK